MALSLGCTAPAPSTLDGHLSLPDPLHVLVQGETNLPDQAQILVTVQNPQDKSVLVQGLPLVKEGRFHALVGLSNELAKGTYPVRLTFSPAAFDWSRGKVPTIVGRKGEHLSGPLAKKEGDLTILQRDLTLVIP